MRKQIDDNKIEGGNMMEEINKRIGQIEKEVFKKKINVETEEKKRSKEKMKRIEKQKEEEEKKNQEKIAAR